METSLLSINEALDTAFEIFHEMADHNLEDEDMQRYQTLFDELGGGMAVEAAADWESVTHENIDRNVFIEIKIGLIENDKLNDVFVRILLSRDPEQKSCYVLWKRAGTFVQL